MLNGIDSSGRCSHLRRMGSLKTVLTYTRPNEAEVAKVFLESRGVGTQLVREAAAAQTPQGQCSIQVQVNEDEFDLAWSALRERSGSRERVAELDRSIMRSTAFFFGAAIPVGLVAFWLLPQMWGAPLPVRSIRGWPAWQHGPIALNLRVIAAILIAIIVGIGSAHFATKKSSASRLRP
jgi:hypothetical protein